jgi:hypothetical protein
VKTPVLPLGFSACSLLATALLLAAPGQAAAPDTTPARSVRNLTLKVSANGRHLVDQEGQPFFYLGDTCWLFKRLNREELDEYLKDRVSKGFTVIQAYAAMLAGAAGHGYGSLDLFYFYKDADGPFPKNGFQHWRTAAAYAGSRQVGLMRRLFEQRPWHKMVPDQSILAVPPGDGPYRLAAARAEDGCLVIAYTPRGQRLSIHMNKLAGPKVNARWYDPRDGKWQDIGEFANTGDREFPAPTQGPASDWVLVLDAMP